MGWYARKGERSQMVGLWEMFTVKSKNFFAKMRIKKFINKKNMYNIKFF